MKNTCREFNRSVLRWALLLLVASFHTMRGVAATNVVLAGENLQTRIDAAASGDVMVIQSGAYGGVTINKELTLVRSGTEDVQLLGPLSINTASPVAIFQFRFADTVNLEGGASVSFQESRFDRAVGASGGKLTFRKSEIVGELSLTGTALTGLRLTNHASITATSAPNSGVPMILAQSHLAGKLEATGYRVHLAYSRCFEVVLHDGEGVLVGNQIRKPNGFGNAVGLSRSRLQMRNCDIDASPDGHPYYEVTFCVGIYDSEAVIENCLITGHTYYWNPPHPISSGIDIQGDSSNVTITGCIVTSLRDDGGGQGYVIRRIGNGSVSVVNCCVWGSPELNGVTSYQTLFTDPKLAPDRTLASDSPCRNAGSSDAVYNDRDGTRNDMGFTGGPLYNPANFTTDLPMAFWLNTTPRKVLKGVNNTIRVDAAATAGH